MAKKQHIIPTEIITVAGYSLSAMLMVFACALYLGWLPSNAKQPDGTQLQAQKPAIPVIKSPDAPPKVRVAPLDEDNAPEPPAQTAERKAIEPDPQPDPPAEDPAPLPELPAAQPPSPEPEQDLPKSARIEPRAHHAPEAFAIQEAPETPDEAPSSGGLKQIPDEPELAIVETPALPEKPEEAPSPSAEEGQEADAEPLPDKTKTAEIKPDTEPSPVPGDDENRVAEQPERSETSSPKVRVIVPPGGPSPVAEQPSVVIRIPPSTPKAEEPAAQDPVAVPRPKPLRRKTAEAPEPTDPPQVRVIAPPVEPLAPRPKPKTVIRIPATPKKAPKTDGLAIETTGGTTPQPPAAPALKGAPRPMPKPEKVAQAPIPPVTVAVEPEEVTQPRQAAPAKPKVKRQRAAPRKRQRVQVARAEPRKTRQPRAGRVRIHRPPPSQNVSIDQDTYCLAMAIYFEAGRKGLQAQVAVTRDILHRVESFNFPNSVCEVIYQYAHRRGRCRYAFACDGLPDRPRNRVVWQRAKMLAKEQIRCGSRCGCYIDKPTLVGTSKGRGRRVIRCSANIRTPAAPRRVANAVGENQLSFKPASALLGDEPVSPLGRTQP